MQYVPNAAKYMSTLLPSPWWIWQLSLGRVSPGQVAEAEGPHCVCIGSNGCARRWLAKKDTPTHTNTHQTRFHFLQMICQNFFQIQTLKRRETEKRNNLCVNSLIRHCSNAAQSPVIYLQLHWLGFSRGLSNTWRKPDQNIILSLPIPPTLFPQVLCLSNKQRPPKKKIIYNKHKLKIYLLLLLYLNNGHRRVLIGSFSHYNNKHNV